MKRLIIILALAVSACGPKPPPNLTPQITAQFYATSILKDLDIIRDFAVDGGKTTPPIFGKATVLAVVNWHESAAKIIHAAPAGWKAAATAALNELPSKLPAADAPKFKAYIDAAKTFIAETP